MAFNEGVLAALRARRQRDFGTPGGDPGSAGATRVSDGELAQRAASGDRDAFEELYRRHVEAAWRVAQAVTNDEHDAADATSEAFVRVLRALQAGRLAPKDHFRPYLIAAARNSAIDILRRRRRAGRHTPAAPGVDPLGPVDSVDKDEEASLIAKAFRSLPERWRMTLWLTEVEGLSPSEAAPLLGVSGDGARQLAMRARAGLRHRYLQAHVDGQVANECRFAVEHLVTYAGGNLAPRDVVKVERHLAGCETCRSRLRELEDVGRRLRGLVLPLPLGLGAAAVFGRSGKAFAAAGPRGMATLKRLAGHAGRPLAACCGALLALDLVGITVVGSPPAARTARPSATQPAAATLPGNATAATGGSAQLPSPPATTAAGPTAPRAVVGPSSPAATPAPLAAPPPAPPRGSPAPGPALQAGVAVLPGTSLSLGASAGIGPGSCTGIWVRSPVAGCAPPPAPAGSVVTANLQGSLVP